MAVISGNNTKFEASLKDFKEAFSRTKTGDFKHSVGTTKGELYVDNGKLCSANIHGGKDTVTNEVSNKALREALIEAFRGAGASDKFLEDVRARLFGDEDGADISNTALQRSDVKDLIVSWEQNKLNSTDKIGQAAREARRAVAPKALSSRDISLLRATGRSKELARICATYEKNAADLKTFVAKFKGDDEKGYDENQSHLYLTQDAEKAFKMFAAALGEAADVGRMYLRQKVVDANKASQKMKQIFVNFLDNHPECGELFVAFRQCCAKVEKRHPMGDACYYDENGDNAWKKITYGEPYIEDERSVEVDGVNWDVGWDDFIKDCIDTVHPALDPLFKKSAKESFSENAKTARKKV